MIVSLPTRGLWRLLLSLGPLVAIAGFAIALVAQERFTSTHGTGFVGMELMHGPVYRTSTLILVAALLFLLMALSMWYLKLRPSVPDIAHVRWIIWGATAVTLTGAMIVTLTTQFGHPTDVAFLGIGGFLLFGAASFQMGRVARRSRSVPQHVGWLLQAVPLAASIVIVTRTTMLERPALVLSACFA